jgi:DNA polymerase III delta prime subunit
MEEFLWVERYRPQTVDECILPDRLKTVFQEYVKKQEIPNLLLFGPAGCGKTTVAKAMCMEIGCNYLYINASLERGIDILRNKIVGYASTMSLTGGRKVIILDEADGLTKETQDALRGAIEQFSSNCTFILTVNYKAKLLDAIHSRCSLLDFFLTKEERPKMASLMFKRIEQILKKEGVTYEKPVLIKLVEKYFPDYRRLLGELQRFSSLGNIDTGTLAQLDNIRNLNELMKALKAKDFGVMRRWVVANTDVDVSTIYRNIYDALYTHLKPETIPIAIVIIAKYQYQSAFVVDQEINLVACLTEIMVDCTFV